MKLFTGKKIALYSAAIGAVVVGLITRFKKRNPYAEKLRQSMKNGADKLADTINKLDRDQATDHANEQIDAFAKDAKKQLKQAVRDSKESVDESRIAEDIDRIVDDAKQSLEDARNTTADAADKAKARLLKISGRSKKQIHKLVDSLPS